MAEKENKKDRKSCVEDCDREFIQCVENWRQDCLERFGSCSAACKM